MLNRIVDLIANDLVDPDIGKQLRPEFLDQLRKALQETKIGKRGQPAAEFAQELGISWDELWCWVCSRRY